MMDEDLSVFFDDVGGFAVPAVWGTHTAAVILSAPSDDIFGGAAQGMDYTAELAASDLPGITRDDVLTINGDTYHLREVPRLIGDGKIKRLTLGKGAL